MMGIRSNSYLREFENRYSPPVMPLWCRKLQVMAAARASAASSGFGLTLRPRWTRTISSIWVLVAEP